MYLEVPTNASKTEGTPQWNIDAVRSREHRFETCLCKQATGDRLRPASQFVLQDYAAIA